MGGAGRGAGKAEYIMPKHAERVLKQRDELEMTLLNRHMEEVIRVWGWERVFKAMSWVADMQADKMNSQLISDRLKTIGKMLDTDNGG